MKKYEIEINNEVYRVTVKELPADTDMTTPAPAPAQATEQATEQATPAAKPTPVTQPAQATSTSGTEVKAPMSGTIYKVVVSPGQAVSKGDALIILEAMKMENEIVAPRDGVVGEIHVSPNESVQSDQLLLTI